MVDKTSSIKRKLMGEISESILYKMREGSIEKERGNELDKLALRLLDEFGKEDAIKTASEMEKRYPKNSESQITWELIRNRIKELKHSL